MTRRRASVQVASCGHCAIEGPDEYGKFELVESWHCPVHGEAVEPDAVLPQWCGEDEEDEPRAA